MNYFKDFKDFEDFYFGLGWVGCVEGFGMLDVCAWDFKGFFFGLLF